MILSNGQEYMDLGLEGDGWFHHAGILKPSVLTVATEGKSFRELLTKVLQRAMRSVKKKVGPDWTTVVEDGVFHIGAHYKGGAKDTLPQNHYHLMSPAPITEDQEPVEGATEENPAGVPQCLPPIIIKACELGTLDTTQLL
eukprot:g21804.t1